LLFPLREKFEVSISNGGENFSDNLDVRLLGKVLRKFEIDLFLIFIKNLSFHNLDSIQVLLNLRITLELRNKLL